MEEEKGEDRSWDLNKNGKKQETELYIEYTNNSKLFYSTPGHWQA